jgi:two-component system sensor histidine kinase MprB
MSLRVRLGLAAGLAVAIAVIAVAVSSYAGTRSDLRGQIDQSLTDRAQHALPGRTPGADSGAPPPGAAGFFGGGRLHLQPRGGRFGGAQGVVELISATGRVSGPGGRHPIPVDARMRSLARSGRGRYFTDITVRGTSPRATSLRVLVTGAGSAGAVVVALPLTSVNHTLSDQLILLAIIAAGGIALAALLGVLVARAALAPIARFTRQTEAIAASPERLGTDRLQVDGRDELARLARTFNETLDALEHSVAAQRNLVADASHELRTPIATIRANLQLMRDEEGLPPGEREALRRDVIEELDELTALVSDVVELDRRRRPPR